MDQSPPKFLGVNMRYYRVHNKPKYQAEGYPAGYYRVEDNPPKIPALYSWKDFYFHGTRERLMDPGIYKRLFEIRG